MIDTFHISPKKTTCWYGKYQKILEHIIPYLLAQILPFMQMCPKIPSGMANSLDPDQTAPEGAVWSGSKLYAYVILSDTWV